MKKIIFILTAILVFNYGLEAQTILNDLTIQGHITRTGTSNPWDFQPVFVHCESFYGGSYNDTIFTDNNGFYSFSIINGSVSGTNLDFYVFSLSYDRIILHTVSNNNGNTDLVTLNFDMCYKNPDFTCTSYYLCTPSSLNPQTVSFSDYSTSSNGVINSWSWDFGDGNTSTVQNPTHTYSSIGTYMVCLSVTDNISNSDEFCDMVYARPCEVSYSTLHNVLDANFVASTTSPYKTVWLWSIDPVSFGPTHNDTLNFHFPQTGMYTVWLYGIDSTGCYDENYQFITIDQTINDLDGFVLLAGPETDFADVILIQNNILSGIYTNIDTMATDTAGHFCFHNVPSGQYIIKASLTPSSAYYSDYLPTYYTSSIDWVGAVNITMPCMSTDHYYINMIASTPPLFGPGNINGSITQGTKAPGDPIQNAEIILYDHNMIPQICNFSDVNGTYGFHNIAYGQYYVEVDIPGKLCQPILVILDSVSPNINDLNFVVSLSEVLNINNNELSSPNIISINPNPATDRITIFSSDNKETSISIYNLIGDLILQKVLDNPKIEIDISPLSKGMYIIKVKGLNWTIQKKIIKK